MQRQMLHPPRPQPQLPALPAARRFLLDQGRRRLEVTLSDGASLRPSGAAWRSPGKGRARLCPHGTQTP